MNASLRIVVADDDQGTRKLLQQFLTEIGHTVHLSCDGLELVEICHSQNVDLAIIDICMPRLDGLEAAERVCQQRPIPLVVISGFNQPATVDRACSLPVFGYLTKPIKKADVAPAVAIARARFQELHVLSQEAQSLRQALCDRKTIERAKGILMRESGLEEAAAFQHLQKAARRSSKKMIEIAQTIITAHEITHAASRDDASA